VLINIYTAAIIYGGLYTNGAYSRWLIVNGLLVNKNHTGIL